MINRTGLGIACALAAAGLYGFVPNLVHIGNLHGVPSVEATFARTSLIAVVLAIVGILQAQSFFIPRAAYGSFAAQSASTLAISVGYLASVQFIAVSLSVIIFFTFPVIILLAAPLIEGRKPGPVRIAIAGFAFLGLAIAVGPSFQSIDLRGVALALLSSAGAAVQFFSGRALSRYLPAAVLGSLAHFAIWPGTLAVALWFGGGVINIFPGGSADAIGFAALAGLGLVYVIAFFLQMSSLRYAPASTVAPFYNLEPIVTTAIAGVVLGERLAMNQYAGGAMVLAALIASSLYGKWQARQA
jgi:drug/metabolite transporter (DMT)-like permease